MARVHHFSHTWKATALQEVFLPTVSLLFIEKKFHRRIVRQADGTKRITVLNQQAGGGLAIKLIRKETTFVGFNDSRLEKIIFFSFVLIQIHICVCLFELYFSEHSWDRI